MKNRPAACRACRECDVLRQVCAQKACGYGRVKIMQKVGRHMGNV